MGENYNKIINKNKNQEIIFFDLLFLLNSFYPCIVLFCFVFTISHFIKFTFHLNFILLVESYTHTQTQFDFNLILKTFQQCRSRACNCDAREKIKIGI